MQDIYLKTPSNDLELAQYYEFRWLQLRKPLSMPLGSEQDQYENESYHCCAMNVQNRVIGVGRITLQSDLTMRIRYMAVDQLYRHQGVGSRILQFLLAHAKQNQVSICWLNAREQAIDFYQKNQFSIVRRIQTDLPIPHYRMQVRI